MNIFEKNRVIFEILELYLSKMIRPEDILSAALTVSQYGMHRNSGYYVSKVVEEAYQKLAIEYDFGRDYEKGTILVVSTQHKDEDGLSNCTLGICDIFSKYYKVTIFNVNFNTKLSLQERAFVLKRTASKFEKVLFIPDLNDPIYIMAFAKNFHRPVICINVSNNIFNIGCSVADLWLDGGYYDMKRSIEQRGIESERVKLLPLGLPKISVNITPKEKLRELIKIPQNHKLIFSCGGWHKYVPIDEDRSFFKMCKDLLDNRDDLHIIVSGLQAPYCPFLKSIENISPRLHLLGYTSRQQYWDLLNACDIYLDSFPQNGCTTLVEAGFLKKPIITLFARGLTLPAFHKNICKDIPEVIQQVNGFLNGELTIQYEELYEKYHGRGRSTLIEDVINSCPTEHRLWEVKPNPENPEVDLDVALSRENNTEWGLYFNNINLTDKPDFELLRIIQRFSIEVNRGLTYKRYI